MFTVSGRGLNKYYIKQIDILPTSLVLSPSFVSLNKIINLNDNSISKQFFKISIYVTYAYIKQLMQFYFVVLLFMFS